MRRLPISPVRRRRALILAALAMLGLAAGAFAFWSAQGTGAASGSVGTLAAPSISSATPGAGTATLTWSSVTPPGSGGVTYFVSRDGGAPSGGCPSSLAPSSATSCTDTGVSPGSHSYTVTTVWRSWTATSKAQTVEVASAAPTVTSTSPSSRGQGAASQNITISGTNFASGATASFSGTGITVNSTTFVSASQVTANITIASNATTGPRDVTVTNPDAGTGTGAGSFTVNAAPTVTSTSPGSRAQGASAQSVVIKGSGFVSGASLASSFGAGVTVSSTTFKSSTELTAVISIESGAATGTRTVTVTNGDAGVASLAGAFTVNAKPTVTSTSPSSRGQGATAQSVVIKGSGFVSGASLASSFGAGVTVSSTTFKSSTELTAVISIESGAATGKRSVTVTNGDGGAATGSEVFTVTAGPTVESTSPSSRGQGATGQNITIKGSGFVSGATASFSGTGITVSSTTFKNASELTATVTITSGASTGARDVTVTNPDAGADSLPGGFTVNAGPTVEATSPNSCDRGGTENVTISGANFVSGAAVAFSGTGIKVNSTTFESSTELTVNITVEAGAATGARSVTVTNPDAGTGSLASGFTVNGVPTVASTSPSSGDQGGTQNVAVKGTNLESGASVSFSGAAITVNSTTFVSSTELTASVTIAGGAATGARTVTVTNPDTTTASLAGAFTVNAKPTVTSTSPSSRGQGASAQEIAVKGTNLESGAIVSFSGAGITVNSTTFVSATEVKANISIASGAATGARTVTVTNPDTTTASLSSGFTVNPGPTITSPTLASPVNPGHNGTTTFTMTGTNFVSGLVVTGNGTAEVSSFTWVSSTSIKVTVTGKGENKGPGSFTVINPDAGQATSQEGSFKNG
jgi:hypothetical protein